MSVQLSDADEIWDRACLENGGSHPRVGDRALTDLILFDSVAANGGLFHVFDALEESEVEAAFRGFRFFGLNEVLNFLEKVSMLSEDEQDNMSEDYWKLTENGAVIMKAFNDYYSLYPNQFAPIDQ